MSKIYAVASQKGGVAKTTTAINMGVEMARQGYKTLLVDCDAQGSLTASLGYQQPDSIEDTLAWGRLSVDLYKIVAYMVELCALNVPYICAKIV